MYVDKYSIQDIGTKYMEKGKERHNQILTELKSSVDNVRNVTI